MAGIGKFQKQAEEALVKMLDKEGRRIMNECMSEKNYQNQSYHLISSYGYAVYVRGKRRAFGVAPLRHSMLKGEGKSWPGRNEEIFGADEIGAFFDAEPGETGGYVPVNPKGAELAIAAAMPYGEVLEKRGYRVVSMAYDKLKEIQQNFPNASVATILNGKARNG